MDKQYATVQGRQMAYVEAGSGDPIVFLHGNPTSSYLWRNIIPHVSDQGRCIAPDLIGMGDSDKLPHSGPDSYRFVEHRSYLDGFLETLGVEDSVIFVIHDWGSALGFDWAHRHQEAVKGIAYMEAICGPVSFEDWPEQASRVFDGMRSEAGEEIILEKNVFIERILPSSMIRDLTDEEMDEYRRPYLEPGESRRPTLTWPREIPFDGQPADVAEVVDSYATWLASSEIPKLYIHTEPGFLSTIFADTCRHWPNQSEVTVKGIHFIQEDAPDEIGRAIATWLAKI